MLQSYGAGNVPTNRDDIIEELRMATKRGVIIVNTTQCSTGCVSNTYEAGKMLQKAGTIQFKVFESRDNYANLNTQTFLVQMLKHKVI